MLELYALEKATLNLNLLAKMLTPTSWNLNVKSVLEGVLTTLQRRILSKKQLVQIVRLAHSNKEFICSRLSIIKIETSIASESDGVEIPGLSFESCLGSLERNRDNEQRSVDCYHKWK